MGITIHYSGRAASWDALTKLLTAAQMFAAQREWMFAIYEDPMGIMDDKDRDNPDTEATEHEGPFRGVVIRPHKMCEPVRFNFTVNNTMTPAFTKTQFAPFDIHVDVIRLLREIEPFMAELEVMDEAGLWETGDESAARAKFDSLGSIIGAFARELEESGLDVEDGPDIYSLGLDDPEGDEGDSAEPDKPPYG